MAPDQRATAFEARSLTDAELRAFIESHLGHSLDRWPPTSWSLPLLTLAAFRYNPDLDVARAQWDVARAGEITAGARPNPSLGFTPQYDVNAVAGISPWTLGFVIDVPIETASKRGHRVARAQHLADAARLDVGGVAWRVRARVREALLDLDASRETLAVLERQVAAQETNLRLLTRPGATASPFETTQARVALDQSHLASEDARRQAAEARARLAAAIGVAVAGLGSAEFSFEALDPATLPSAPPVDELKREALHNRPDILATLAQYAAAEADLALEIARQYPDLNLGPGYTWDQGENKWSLGLSLTLPIFQHNQGPIAEAEARRGEAAARFAALQARVIGEIEQARVGYEAALAKRDAAASLFTSEQRQHRTLRGMVRGPVGRLALINAELQLDAADLARVASGIEAAHALGALEDAVERPLHPLDLSPFPTAEASPTREGQR